MVTGVKFHRLSGGNQKIFTHKWSYWEGFVIPCHTTWLRATKNTAFSVFKANFHALKPLKLFWKWFSLKNMKLVEHLSLKLLFVLMIFKRFYLVKIGLIFDGSQLSFVSWYHKTLSVCLSGCKKLLISTWKPTNFHNCHHTSEQVCLRIPKVFFSES